MKFVEKMIGPLILGILLLVPFNAVSAERIYRVKLVINAEDSIRNRIESFISRELRSLGDVTLSWEDHDYIISVITITRNLGYKSEIVFSAFYTERLDLDIFAGNLDKGLRRIMELDYQHVYGAPSQFLWLGNLDDIKNICEELVAAFDGANLQPRRKIWQMIEDSQ